MPGSDFNYKVALATGLKSLQAGQLRKAEDQFRYLREKFPNVDGGYRGIAKVATEEGDPGKALATLREGAMALAKAGERAGAIGLLREILTLDPSDHTSHRRLAAALVLANDRPGAVIEHERYARLLIGQPGGLERARQELAYAREQLPVEPALADVERRMLGAPADEGSILPENTLPVAAPSRSGPVNEPSRQAERASNTERGDLEARAVRALASSSPDAAELVLDAAREHAHAGRTSAAIDLLLAAVGAGVGVHDAERLLAELSGSAGMHDPARERLALLERLAKTP